MGNGKTEFIKIPDNLHEYVYGKQSSPKSIEELKEVSEEVRINPSFKYGKVTTSSPELESISTNSVSIPEHKVYKSLSPLIKNTDYIHRDYGRVFVEIVTDGGTAVIIRIGGKSGIRKRIHNEGFEEQPDIKEELEKNVKNVFLTNFFNLKNNFFTNSYFYTTSVGEIVYLNRNFSPHMVDLINVAEDIQLFIPSDFVSACSFDEEMVESYLRILNTFEFGTIHLEKNYEMDGFENIKNNSTSNPLINNSFYKVTIQSDMTTFKWLLCQMISCLFIYDASIIAGLFMQMRKELCSEELSDWQLFLLAILFQRNYGRSQEIFISLYPFEGREYSVNAVPNIYLQSNSLENFKDRLSKENIRNNNQSFPFSYSLIKRQDFDKMLKLSSSKELKTFINNYKKYML